jgi:hypothetical protein
VTRELLFSLTSKDFEIQTFRSGGPGGQHQNKTSSGVRFIHHPSGARGESREERAQLQNKKKALRKLVATPQFRFWVHETVLELDGRSTALGLSLAELGILLADKDPDHYRVEVWRDGTWMELS